MSAPATREMPQDASNFHHKTDNSGDLTVYTGHGLCYTYTGMHTSLFFQIQKTTNEGSDTLQKWTLQTRLEINK